MVLGIEKIDKCDTRVHKLIDLVAGIWHNVTITSGYRSPEYNASVGGAKNSLHCLGLAVDFTVPEEDILMVIAAIYLQRSVIEFKGIGIDIFKNYVHIDFRDSKTIVKWFYGRDGKQV